MELRSGYEGIGELGFNVSIPAQGSAQGSAQSREGIPGGARILFPEQRELSRNTQTELSVMPGKWKFIALIQGNNNWRYFTEDEEGVYRLSTRLETGGIWYLAASETECGVYETLALFTVK